MNLNKLLKSLLTSLGLLSLLLFSHPVQAFGVSPSAVSFDNLLPDRVYEHRFYLSDSSLGSVRQFELSAHEDPQGILSFASEILTLNPEETEAIGRLYIDTRGLEVGEYGFSIQVKETVAENEGVNRIIPGISFSGKIRVTNDLISSLAVNNLRLIKDEEERTLELALSLWNEGNVAETPDLVELIIVNEKGEDVHSEVWFTEEEILPLQSEELLFEVDLPKMKAGNHFIHLSVLEDGKWIYESDPLPYQILAKVRSDWLITVLLLILLTVSLYLYFSSRPPK